MRTYSDKVARMVPLNFRAYIVTGVTDATIGDKKQYTLKLQQIFAIPAYTGVILYGAVNDNATGYTLSPIPSWDDVEPYNRGTGDITATYSGSVNCKNYMVPMVESTVLYPYYKDAPENWAYDTKNLPNMKQYYKTSGGTVTDRNFVLAQYYNTSVKDSGDDYWGFFRVKAGAKSSANKAYLSLPKDVFKSAKGAEALVVKPTSPDEMIFRSKEWNQDVSTGNWGKRADDLGVLEAKFVGEIEEDDVTGISYVNIEVEEEGDYYTLQGVKVAQPQKGVYIKNGKKVIIK